jgi:hypothetical protein
MGVFNGIRVVWVVWLVLLFASLQACQPDQGESGRRHGTGAARHSQPGSGETSGEVAFVDLPPEARETLRAIRVTAWCSATSSMSCQNRRAAITMNTR